MPEPYGIETAGSFGTGNAYVIVTVGTTDFTLIGAVDNRIGVVFEATGTGLGTGTAHRLNSQLGRIGGKLLADNLLRDGIDLAFKNTAYDTPVLYLKIDPEVKDTVSAGSFVLGIRYRIRTLGTTNFLLIGSLSNTVGTIFTATGAGTGTGTADRASDSITDTDAADALDPTSNQGAGSAVGFNTDTPAYDLDIDNDAKTTNVEATSQANISNIIINAAGYVSTTVGPLYISPSGHDPIINFDRMTSDDLFFSDNVIGSFADADIELNPSGTGTIELESTANITGDFNVSGSVTIDGDLTTPGSISFGDSTFTAPSTGDTLDFNTFIRQDLNPGIDNEFNLGMPNNKWGELYAPDWTNIGNLRPSRMRISDQQILDGVAMEIRPLQSNDDLILSPDTGVIRIENLTITDDVLSTAQKDLVPNNLPSRPTTTLVGFNLSGDGTSIIRRGVTTGTLQKYTMVTPYDFQNTVLAQTVSIPAGSAISSSGASFIRHVYVEENGQYLYRFASLSTGNVTIAQYYMSTPFDLTTLIWQKDRTFAHLGTGHPFWAFISPDGTKLFYGNDNILRQLDMSVPYDIATATVTSIDVAPYIIDVSLPLFFLDAGITAYSARGGDGIRFICSTPYDLKTAKITYLTLESSIFPTSGSFSQRVTLGGHSWVRTVPGSPTIYPQQTELLFQGSFQGASNVIVRYIISDFIGIIRNELNTSTPVQFASTGAGYLRFMGSNAFVIPAGDSSTRPSAPELGDTRWNTDEQYLECFDGSVYVIATGGGDEVTEELMEELGNVYSLILG